MRDNDILKPLKNKDVDATNYEFKQLEQMRWSKSEFKQKMYELEIKRGSEGYKATVAKQRKELGLQ